MTRTQRIANIQKRIRDAQDAIERWIHVRHYTGRKQTAKLASRKIEMYEERRDLWEERLVQAELGTPKVYSRA